MPLEINELLVRVEVAEGRPARDSATQGPAAQPESRQKDELIAECVEQVLEILRRREER